MLIIIIIIFLKTMIQWISLLHPLKKPRTITRSITRTIIKITSTIIKL